MARWAALVAAALVCGGAFFATVGTPQVVHAQAVPSAVAPTVSSGRAGAARVAAGAPGAPAAGASAPEGVVNVNSAGEEELQRLPGVGPARATAIVALRTRLQRFRAAEDLLRVRGIGRVGFRRMRPYVSLAGETTLETRPGRTPRAAEQ